MIQNSKTRSWMSSAFLMGSGHFFCDLFPGILAPILPLLMIQFDLSISFAGMLIALSSFFNSFSQPLFGWLSDHVDKKYFVILGPLMSALFYTSVSYMPNKWLLMLVICLGGIGVAMFHPQAAKIIHHTSGEHKGRAMSIFTTGGTLGYPLGALIITSVVLPLTGTLKGAPLMTFPIIIFILLVAKKIPALSHADMDRSAPRPRPSFKQISAISVFVSIGVVRSLVVVSYNTLIPILFAQQGLSLQQGGVALFIFHSMGGIGGLLGGFMSDRFSHKLLIITSFVLCTVFLALFNMNSGVLALIYLGFAGMMLYFSIPTVITEAQATLPVYMGTVSSMVMGFSWGVGGLLLAPVSRLADLYGIAPILEILAYAPLLVIGLAFMIRTKETGDAHMPEYI